MCALCTEPGLAEGALAEVQLKDGKKLQASLVVAADGPRSPTRAMAGLRPSGWAYNQVHPDILIHLFTPRLRPCLPQPMHGTASPKL